VLVLRPGALGDTLLAVPALRALRARFRPVTLAAHAGAARLLAELGEVDSGMAFDEPRLSELFRDDAAPSGEDIVAWLSSPPPPALRTALVFAPSRPAGTKRHCAQYLLDTLAPLGCSAVMDDRALTVTAIRSDEVLLHPGSGSPAKNWPAARFADVVRGLGDVPVRLIVGEADSSAAAAVDAALGRRLPRLEQPPLGELAPRLAGCHGYLGNDSGVSHLAGLCGARTVVLFGPTPAAVWRPLGPRVAVMPFEAETQDVLQALSA
jgi:ADP-heptose:LPS heptosyltransferase